MLATALAPEFEYYKASDISKEAFENDKTVRDVAREQTDPSEELDEILDAQDNGHIEAGLNLIHWAPQQRFS